MVPNKYDMWLEPDNLKRIEAWARDGLAETQIARNMRITVQSLTNWKKKHKPILDALKRGKEIVDIEVENALFKRAIGYEYDEIKTIVEQDMAGNKKTKVEKVKKQVLPDVTAQIFWLKNRKTKVWRDVQRQEFEEAKLEIERRKLAILEEREDKGKNEDTVTIIDDIGDEDGDN